MSRFAEQIADGKPPIWVAYLLAPAFMVFCGLRVIVRSESPLPLTVILLAMGLVCAITLHAWVLLKHWFTARNR